MHLYPQQQLALATIEAFIESSDAVFILKGYAGTGKTTIIRELCDTLERKGRLPILMAPTGRAAKVLREKTGKDAKTIHKHIYHRDGIITNTHDQNGKPLDKNQEDAVGIDDIDFHFSLGLLTDKHEGANSIIIVDEASLIGSRPTKQELLHFGTDALLPDLLTFAQLSIGTKIIFVGDPAQLPPVGDNISNALNEDYFRSLQIGVQSFMLEKVVRQKESSTVLVNAMKVRSLIGTPLRNRLSFDLKSGEFEEVNPSEVIDKFVNKCPIPTLGKTVIICYTNSQALDYNRAVRSRYFSDDNPHECDIIQIVHNRMGTESCPELLNGDFIRLVNEPCNTETHKIPVWVSRKGQKERIIIELKFIDISFETDGGLPGSAKLLNSFLVNNKPSLGHTESVALYLDFVMRNAQLEKGTKDFNMALMTDPYYNAIHAKYGYAITCHKSQGGEWDTVFVDYSRRTGLDDDSLRWNYTATTRAAHCLFGVNIPHITPFGKFDIAAVRQISKLSPDVICIVDTDCPLLPSNASATCKAKCNSVVSALSETGYELLSVSQKPYRDRYVIKYPNGDIREFDCQYNGTGIFTSFNALLPVEGDEVILQSLRDEREYTYLVEYSPSTECLKDLYNAMTSATDELGIRITGIKEYTAQYYVLYGLRTDASFASLQFYFNSKGFVTRAIASSAIGQDDVLLGRLISRLKELINT